MATKPFVSSRCDSRLGKQDDVRLQTQTTYEKNRLLEKPKAIGAMSIEELDGELKKGVASIQSGNVIAEEDIDIDYD